MEGKPLETLHRALLDNNYDVPEDYASFERTLTANGNQGYQNRHALWKALSRDGFDVPDDYDTFSRTLFTPAKKQQQRQQPTSAGTTPWWNQDKGYQQDQASLAQPQGSSVPRATSTTPTDLQNIKPKTQMPSGFGQLDINQANQMGGGMDWNEEANQEQNIARDVYDAVRGDKDAAKRSGVDAAVQRMKEEQEYLNATGKPLKNIVDSELYAPTASRDEEGNMLLGQTTDQQRTAQYQQELRDAEARESVKGTPLYDLKYGKEKPIDLQIEDTYAELEDLEKQIRSRRIDRLGSLSRGMLLAGNMNSKPQEKDVELDNLLATKRFLERKITALEAKRDEAGYFRGAADVLSDPASHSFGLLDASDAIAINNLKKKIWSVGGDISKLSDIDQALAKSIIQSNEAQQLNEDNNSYNYGQSLGHTISFMEGFGVTGGGFMPLVKGGIKTGAKIGSKLATKAFGDYMTKSLGTKVLGKTIEYTGKGLGLVAGSEAAGFLLGNTAQMPNMVADIMNRHNGKLTSDKDGMLSFKDGQDLAKSFLYSQFERSGENASEMVGLAFDKIPELLGKAIQKTVVGKVAKRIADNSFWKAGEKGLNYLGVASAWGELMEEEYGMARTELINQVTNGDFAPNGSGLFDWDNQLKTAITVGLTSMILRAPSMIASGTQQANYYANKYNLNSSDREMRSVFNDDTRYKAVKDILDNSDNKNLSSSLSGILKNEGLSKEEKVAAYKYAYDLVKVRGLNIGSVLAAANGYEAPPRVSGYNIKGNVVEEIDQNGNVISTHEYADREEMKAGLYELQQQRFDKNLQDDILAMKNIQGDRYAGLLNQYCSENEIDPAAFEEILSKPSMERTEAEQQMVAPFADILHNSLYDNTVLHEEKSKQDGEELADADAIDLEDDSEQGRIMNEQWQLAQNNRNALFESNEELKQEVEAMEAQGLPHQEIVSRLDTFSNDDIQGVIDYYNTQAKFEAYLNRMSRKINEEARNSRERHTLKGTINGEADLRNVYTISDGTNEYYLVSGNVTTDSEGRITGSDSGLIIGMDLDGSLVNIGDTSGYSVMPSVQTLDQFEEQERTRLEEEWTGRIDPNGLLSQQEEAAQEQPQTEQPQNTEEPVGVEAGATTGTGANEAPTTPSSVSIESVTDNEGVKRYENGVSVDDAIADMQADGLDVNEEADLAISEAQAELAKIKQPKTRAERVKNAAKVAELQNTINYYNNVKARWAEMNQPAETNTEEEQAPSAQNLSVEEQKQQRIKEAKEKYGDFFDDDFTKANDVFELVSMWVGRKRNLAWDDVNGKRGLQKELGWTRKIGGDTKYIETLLAKNGEGMGVDDFVHMVWESPENDVNGEKRYDTDEIKNALLELLRSAQSKSDVVDYALNTRIAQAEAAMQQAQEMGEQEQEQIEPVGEIPEGGLAFPPPTGKEITNDVNEGTETGNNNVPLQKESTEEEKAAKSKEDAEKLNGLISELTSQYNSVPIEIIDPYNMSEEEWYNFANDFNGAYLSKEDAEEFREYVKNSEEVPSAGYWPITKKIYFFANNAKLEKVREYFFHENVHGELDKLPNDVVDELVKTFWDNSNTEISNANKEYIKSKYKEEDWFEEFFSSTFGIQMSIGEVSKVINRLTPEQQETVNNIFNNIGYAEESEEREQGEITNQQPEQNEGLGRDTRPVTGEGNVPSARERYIKEHPLTVEEIDAANASQAQKILAKQYLNIEDEYVTEMAKAAYTYIYNKKVAAQKPQQVETPAVEAKPETPSTTKEEKPKAEEQPTQEEKPQQSAQEAAKAKMAAALAKLKKHGKKSDENTDRYSVENLTPEQIEDMFEVVEAGAELGYTLLDGVQSKEEWVNQMRDMIGEPLKDATGYNDTEVTELLNDMWNYPYAVEEQTKTVGEWAKEKGINVNENTNGTGETNGDNVPQSEELPAGTNVASTSEAGTVESGNNEANPESGGETGFGPLFGGTNSGTGEVGETTPGTTGAEIEGTAEGNGETGSEGKPTVRGGIQGTAGSLQGNTETGSSASSSGQSSPTTGTTGKQTGRTGRTGQSGNQGGGVRGRVDVNGGTGNGGGETTGTGEIGSPSMGQSERVTEKKPLADITQEKAPYKPSSIGGKFAIGSVVPSGIADAIAKAFERLKKKFKKNTLDFVREELGYKSNEEMLSDFDSGKTNGLASEQVDAVALAIGKMKDGKSFIVGDMTGVGKGRTAAALIRWGIKHGKKVVFITEKSGLFSDMYRDLTDIGSDYLPFVTNNDTDANITDADGNKVIPKPNPKMQAALWQSDKDELPRDKKGRQYDFVMTTYSQASNPRGVNGKRKLEWLKEYAKDAIVIMDESHNASGESNRGEYFREIVKNASGVTFLSATYAKRPGNMLLYAIKSSMSELNMAVGEMLNAIKEYGVAMQELMASSLFGSGEMIRRERDMSDVKTTWTDPKEIYSEEDYEQCRKTSDKTMAVINDIIDFQRSYIDPIVKAHEKEHEEANALAAMTGANQVHTTNTAYKSQVSNVVNLMTYAMKAKKAAEMAIEQIKQGKKPVIAVENTLDSYIKELPDEMDSAGFGPVLEKGIRFSLRYATASYEKGEDGKYHKVEGSEVYFNAEDELDDDGLRALENLRQRIADYLGDKDKIDLTLSPIDLIKQMIADAGYNCGEITGRNTQLVRKENGGFKKESLKQDKKGAARKFNGGSKSKPLPEEEQYQALVLNVAGATGISLHSSKMFGNQSPRTMIILQPARDVNTEVQMRGRIDRTGQVHRGEYFYLTSPIPAEQKITMMLKQKLASLDAQSVGTKEVSSNRVDSQDMDNKYGDQVCFDFLMEHLLDINAYLENGIYQDKKTREWTYDPGLLYDVLKDLQRMPCDMQEMVINELTQRYADQIDYLNQNGINDLETTAMNLEAVTIDRATFVKGKDNESVNEFAHDTTIERVEVNVLKKPMRSSDIKKKMKDLDSLDEDGLPKGGVLQQTTDKVKAVVDALYADREAKYAEKEQKLEEKLRKEHPKNDDQTDEEYENMIQNWPSLLELKNKDKADLLTYSANLQEQYNNIYKAAMYLKPGRPYLVPLTDDIGSDAAMMYGRFLGFQMKNGDPRQVQAVFAVKDSRAMITIPVVNKSKVIEKIINERNDMEIVALERNKETYEDLSSEERAKAWDEWWDKMIPKNTNRQIRFMITGNVVQACGSLGKYKGQIVTFTRKNKETGEITLERGMLLAENFDPENFKVRKAVEKKDVWDTYGEVSDTRSNISCHREGSRMVVKFEKRAGEKLSEHPAQKDEELKALAMNNEIRPSGKKAILCVINEENVEKALEHLYREYGYTKEELFVMPDSTEKPDAIVRSNRPYQDIIDQYKDKYGSNQYSVEAKIKQMLKRYKMDVNNDSLKEEIREAVMLRQAYLRRDYATQESNRLAWEVLIRDQQIERAGDDKDIRERAMRIKEAILEELEYRGFKGTQLHLKQGKMTFDDVRNLFNQLNDDKTEEGKAKKALFDKVMSKVSKLPMEIFLNETIDNDTGGWAGGRVINYNWKYMNADYIADQAKADTILHELIHTVTAYADKCVEDGYEHLLDQDMIDAVNELHSIYDAIKNDPDFEHDGQRAYGLTNVREMLSEAGSNSEFRNDLKKKGLWARLKAGFLAFFGIKPNQDMPGAKKVNAYEQIMERLDYLIENFKQEAWEEYYKGTRYGGYGYKKADAMKFNPLEDYQIGEYKKSSLLPRLQDERAEVKQDGKRVAWLYKTNDGYQAETPNWSYLTEAYPTEKEALDALSEDVTNLQYNEQLEILTEDNARKTILNLGYPNDLLKSYGIADKPIRLYGAKLWSKAKKHGYKISDVKDLPKAISNPIAIFKGSQPGSHAILTELEIDGKNVLVSIQIGKGGHDVDFNVVTSIYDKAGNSVINWINKDKMLYCDKEKALDYLSVSAPIAEAQDNQRLVSAAKIVENFDNSKHLNKFNKSNSGQSGEDVDKVSFNPIDAIEQNAEQWRTERDNRRHDISDLDGYSAKQVYHERINRVETMFSEAWQDDMVTFKAGQDAIAHDEDIPDSQNAYMAQNLSYGKTYNEQEAFKNFFKNPLIETINTILKKSGLRTGDIDRYVFTKHGFERNRELFVRDRLELMRKEAGDNQATLLSIDGLEQDYNALKQENYVKLVNGDIDFQEYIAELDYFIRNYIDSKYVPEEHDYSGFREMFGDEDGNYDERDIMADLEATEDVIGEDLINELWNRINLCSQYGLDKYRTSGMSSEDTIKRISNMFHWYVPMRGFKEGDAADDHWQYMTRRDGEAAHLGGLLKHAKGRGSEANYPISTLFSMTYKAISDCNQNDVKQKLWRLVQAHPNDLVIPSDSWVVKDPVTDEWVTAYPEIDSDMSAPMVEAKIREFNERMAALQATGDAKRLKGKVRFDYKVDTKKKSEHIIEVRLNGERKMMIVVGNPRMAQAINGQLKYEGGKSIFAKVNARLKQLMQSMSTSYSLTFSMRNMLRDWTHFSAILNVREGAGYTAAAEKYYFQQKPRMRTLFKKYREGTLDISKEVERDFKDYMDNGGTTGFVHMQKVEDIQKDMEKFIKSQKTGKTIKLNDKFWDWTLGAIEAVNEGVENRARFATFRASRHYAGRTKARSAYDAKEVTVNFNKKGSGRKTAGFKSDDKKVEAAAKVFGSTGQILAANKMFFNATVQAICTIFKNFQNKDGSMNWSYIAKFAGKYATPPMVLGLAMPLINKALLEVAGGDDGDDPYANLPEWVRRKNICVYLGWVPGMGKDDFLTIPIGQELAAFYSLGDMAAGLSYYKDIKPIDKSYDDEILGFFSVFSPVDFETKITDNDEFAPVSEYVGRISSVAAPLVAIGENMSWMGRPIFREDLYNNDKYKPEYQMVYNSTNKQFVEFSKWLNDISGGDDVTRGGVQINPGTMQYLVEQYTGGPGKLFANTFVSAGKDLKELVTKGEPEFNIRKVEGIRAFYQQGDERNQFYRAQAKFRKYKEEADELKYKISNYEKDKDENPEHLLRYNELSNGVDYARMKLINEANRTSKKEGKVGLKDEYKQAQSLSGRERKAAMEAYNMKIAELVRQLDDVAALKAVADSLEKEKK